MTTPEPPATPGTAGPAALTARAPGPDLARGFMLVAIALANSHYFLRGPSYFGGFPTGGSGADRAVGWLLATFVDGRAFPMFGLLFGYGVARIAERQSGRGPRGVRRLLWRRAAGLVAVGVLHGVLLYVGDILSAYGVLLLAGAWLVRWRARWLLLVAAVFWTLTALPSADSLSTGTDPPHVSMLPPDVVTVLTSRPLVIPFVALLGPIGFLCPFALGLLAGRRRILEEPQRHRALLAGVAVVGIGVAALGAQPVALVVAGILPVPGAGTLEFVGPWHDATGALGGLGYAALVALAADRLRAGALRPVADAVAAVGQRSMTCYLAQSVVWTVAFTPFLLDLSGVLTVAGTAALAVGTWLATVALAAWMRRTGRRGPFEVLIRRITYGRMPRQSPARA